MLILAFFIISTTTYFVFSCPPPLLKCNAILFHFKGDFIMDKYLDYFREMLALRGLTDHTLTSYCIYIKAYLNYLTDILHKSPEDIYWNVLRDYIYLPQKFTVLPNRTIIYTFSHFMYFARTKMARSYNSQILLCFFVLEGF